MILVVANERQNGVVCERQGHVIENSASHHCKAYRVIGIGVHSHHLLIGSYGCTSLSDMSDGTLSLTMDKLILYGVVIVIFLPKWNTMRVS